MKDLKIKERIRKGTFAGLALLAVTYLPTSCAKESSPNKAINYLRLETDLIRHEGERLQVYDDKTGKALSSSITAEGNPTIGVGFNLNREDARSRLKKAGLDYTQVYTGTKQITQEQSREWLKYDLAQAVKDARHYVGDEHFQQLNGEAKEIVINLAFNLGSARLGNFQKLKSALIARDYKTASAEMKDSNWYNQTGNRAKELTERMNKLTD